MVASIPTFNDVPLSVVSLGWSLVLSSFLAQTPSCLHCCIVKEASLFFRHKF